MLVGLRVRGCLVPDSPKTRSGYRPTFSFSLLFPQSAGQNLPAERTLTKRHEICGARTRICGSPGRRETPHVFSTTWFAKRHFPDAELSQKRKNQSYPQRSPSHTFHPDARVLNWKVYRRLQSAMASLTTACRLSARVARSRLLSETAARGKCSPSSSRLLRCLRGTGLQLILSDFGRCYQDSAPPRSARPPRTSPCLPFPPP